jgi:hypothetical protein
MSSITTAYYKCGECGNSAFNDYYAYGDSGLMQCSKCHTPITYDSLIKEEHRLAQEACLALTRTDTGDGSRVEHVRFPIVMEQKEKLDLCVRSIREVCTEYELIGIMGQVMGDWLTGISKYGARRERHGREDLPGDLEAPKGNKEGGQDDEQRTT